jgi:hypothetical protein
MPLISVPILGSATGAGVAQLSSEIGTLALLWLVPLVGLAVTGIGARHSLIADVPAEQRRVGSIVVVAAAALVLLIYLVALAALESEVSQSPMARAGVSATSFTGAGFWIAMLAMIAAGGAAFVDLRTAAAGQ